MFENELYAGYQKTLVTAKLTVDRSPSDSQLAKASRTVADMETPDGIDTPDLLFVKFVLASEHENSNADYFKRSELIKARHTPKYKPFDIEHNIEESGSYISSPLFNQTKNTIIGHMIDSAVATKDGTVLTEEEIAELDISDDPTRAREDSLDILGSAVLYKFYFPKTVADIEEMAESGEMCVSMEAWFTGFDFLIGDEIIEHTKATEHYIDDWKKRKVIGGRKVSRVLNGVLFGGVGATEKPANKESVFLTASLAKELDMLKKRHEELHILYNHKKTIELKNEHEEVTRAIARLEGVYNG